MRSYNLKSSVLTPINLKITVVLVTFFLIYILGYKYTLRTLFEEEEKIVLSLNNLNQELIETYKVIEFYKNNPINRNKKINLFFNQDNASYISRIIVNKLLLPYFYSDEINISSPKENRFLNVIEVRNALLTSFDEIIMFLNKISKLNEFITLKSFKWIFPSTASSAQKHDINFSLIVYTPYVRENYFMSVFDKQYGSYNKFRLPRKNNLLISNLDAIKFIGFLSKGKKDKFGLVKLENDNVFKVKIGDYLGLEQHTIIGIYNDEIFIQDKNLNKIKVIALKMENKKLSNVKRFM